MAKKKLNEGLIDKLYLGLLSMVMKGKSKQAKQKFQDNEKIQDAIDDLEYAKMKLRQATKEYADVVKSI